MDKTPAVVTWRKSTWCVTSLLFPLFCQMEKPEVRISNTTVTPFLVETGILKQIFVAFKQLRWMGPNLEALGMVQPVQFIRDTSYKTKKTTIFIGETRKGSRKNDIPLAMSSFQVKNPIAFEASSKRSKNPAGVFLPENLLLRLPFSLVPKDSHSE